MLTEALHAAAAGHVARLPALAAAARGRRRTGYPAREGHSDPFIAEAGPLQGDPLAAIDALRHDARLRPCATITDRSEADAYVRQALSDFQGLLAELGRYLEQALRPLEPLIGLGPFTPSSRRRATNWTIWRPAAFRSMRWRIANTAGGSGALLKRCLPGVPRLGKKSTRALHRQSRLLRRHVP